MLYEIRAIVNMMGNAVATLVVARWEGVFDVETARAVLADPRGARAEEVRLMIEPAPHQAMQDMHK
ncbi:sodium:dicarboxylate symporter [Caballeronia peredens]|nr:sodium:dicarboxylate symporter [Caballeronia peredens]